MDEHAAELDGYIAKYAKDWKFSRIPLVASAIMRVAMYEILYMQDIPNGAAINEAVEIAKKYETPETVKFINGILGSFRAGRDLPVQHLNKPAERMRHRPPPFCFFTQGDAMEQRNRGIDLLRMTAMWMVVILHILNKGGVSGCRGAPVCGARGPHGCWRLPPTAPSTVTD